MTDTEIKNANKEKQRTFLFALADCLGNVTEACTVSGVNRMQYYYWRDNDPKFREELKAVEDIQFDWVESQFFKLLRKGDTASILFYMRTKGKRRGYSEHLEIKDEASSVAPGKLQVEVISKTDEVKPLRRETYNWANKKSDGVSNDSSI